MSAVYGIGYLLGQNAREYDVGPPSMNELPVDQQETLIEKLPMTDEERKKALAKLKSQDHNVR